jgi:cytidylate kinase
LVTSDRPLQVIAIDGPAGSGKSTIAKRLADALGMEYLDTGAMYRAVTYAVLMEGLDLTDRASDETVGWIARRMKLALSQDGTVTVDGVDVTNEIRGQRVTGSVSMVAAIPAVRAELVSRQREWAAMRGGGVLEGRDIGTAVFPDALLKVYLTATPEVRALRRAGEASQQSVAQIAADITRRDALDSEREHDPLRQAEGAIEVDTSDLSIDEVVALIGRQVDLAR